MPGMLATVTIGLALAGGTGAPEARAFTWTTPEGEVWEHAALVERPDPDRDTGMGVMLFGGGLATDLHWTTPGSYEQGGERHRLTISGEETRDADTLASAFVDAGFTVMRFSAIRVGDPLHAEDPAMAQAKPFPATVTMARAAWGALLERAGFGPGQVIAVGHSLGAPRSLLVSEGQAAGYVMLAGAYVTPTKARTSELAGQAAGEEGEDYDGSGEISAWERAAASAIRGGRTRQAERFESRGGSFEWGSDILARTCAPALAVWGGLDTVSYHGAVLEHLLGDQVETVYFPEFGHNLGREEGGLAGPIDGRVVETVVAWAKRRADARAGNGPGRERP